MTTTGNFAPGNAGMILYTDFFIPLFGLLLLRCDGDTVGGSRRNDNSRSSLPPSERRRGQRRLLEPGES